MKKKYYAGLDVGSTTIKLSVFDGNKKLLHSVYRRHFSDVRNALVNMLEEGANLFPKEEIKATITGSAGISIANILEVPFLQEVISCKRAVEEFVDHASVSVELGGEDAKVTYFEEGLDQRMNGTCAGGTGAFIDQMASLLKIDAMALNELAKDYTNIYPIASRCGVFAKSDIQPLLNEGASKENIAVSVFQAVVNQTLGGLCSGRVIKGRVVFLGGPLFYLSELRKRFVQTLGLSSEDAIFPENAHLFVSMGAALSSEKSKSTTFANLVSRLKEYQEGEAFEVERLQPLFESAKEKEAFLNRHAKAKVKERDIKSHKGDCFLGIDAGSTTTKAVLINNQGEILYQYYKSNHGTPLHCALNILKDIYRVLPSKGRIAYSTVTGYGEALIKKGLGVDWGEVETIAHFKAAKEFSPEVDFILDIGGQDMKCLKIKDGAIQSIMLNEACSAGCGSFVETFAESLKMKIEPFAKEALNAKKPVDLGTRCTVFMNSRVKQAQKEGASVADISAGIAYSVIKNVLYKVMKIKDPRDLGNHIIVQGGTFNNNAILRSFELVTGIQPIRPNLAGLMGAYGAALIAKDRFLKGEKTTLLPKAQLEGFSFENTMEKCGKCGNHCTLTVTTFSNGQRFISGNRCERGGEVSSNQEIHPNIFEYKYERLFGYAPLPASRAKRGTIGIPRVLNMYENYPLWFTFLTHLGYRVILSSRSSKKIYHKGMDTIPSDTVCYPAKMVHGHILDLVDKGVEMIFYPCIQKEINEYDDADNHFNCPVVTSYPQLIRNNMDVLREKKVKLMDPFLPIHDSKSLKKRLIEEFASYGITKQEVVDALKKAWEEYGAYRKDIQRKGEEVLQYMNDKKVPGIVLAGRPYHLDPEINHGIPKMITELGMAVLTEDSICHLGKIKSKMRIHDQWMYHSRVLRAAVKVVAEDGLEMVELNSFGCGLDAVIADQIEELLHSAGKLYTAIKIDEIDNLGSARIRIRSLKAVMEERVRNKPVVVKKDYTFKKILFKKSMRANHIILAPQMAPMHSELMEEAFRVSGHNVVVLTKVTSQDIEEGLKYVNNDSCYPAIVVIGQLLNALKSGGYDPHNTSLMMPQTGGGCRATNYVALLRKALEDAGLGHVPVISFNLIGMDKQPGFKLRPSGVKRLLMAVIYGDLLSKVVHRVRPYEKIKGSTNLLYNVWVEKCKESLKKAKFNDFKEDVNGIVGDFSFLRTIETKPKPRVGIVGEIFVKYHPFANNHLAEVLEKEGVEVIIPGLTEFVLYASYDRIVSEKLVGASKMKAALGKYFINYIEKFREEINLNLEGSPRFSPFHTIESMAQKASKVLSLGNNRGEGWLLTAEMMELAQEGIGNIICVQPFGCLPNHVIGKGMLKEVKRIHKGLNIIPIDYDPGASEVNQLNRIKLLLSSAFDKLEEETGSFQEKETKGS
jgi:predicted CoA-substrate-specific enzyme activase